MGYACPVCDTSHSDDVHLANHLAFTALLRGGDHEAFLDDHVPEWESHGDAYLAERVVEHAEETELPADIDELSDSNTHRDHGAAGTFSETAIEDAGPDATSDEVQEILREAREMTNERRSDDSETE